MLLGAFYQFNFFFLTGLDPLHTTQGNLSLRAFRLTPTFMEMIKKDDQFTPERLANSKSFSGDGPE